MIRKAIAALGLLVALSGTAHAATVFSENFDADAAGGSILNFNGFSQFSVSSGTVDLIQSGGFGISCVSGGCVDLDGSTNQPGLMTSSLFNIFAGNTYTFSFAISGNQRGGVSDTLTYGVTGGQLAAQTVTKAPADPFTTITSSFTPGSNASVSVYFQQDGRDNIGIILDNVLVTSAPIVPAVPLPAALPLLAAALGLIGLVSRRRRVA